MDDQLKTIIIDGQEYDLSMFSPRVQRLTQIIIMWEKQLQEQRLEIAKTEAALREANREITGFIKEELAAPAAVEEAPAE
jgi:hypothetical protein